MIRVSPAVDSAAFGCDPTAARLQPPPRSRYRRRPIRNEGRASGSYHFDDTCRGVVDGVSKDIHVSALSEDHAAECPWNAVEAVFAFEGGRSRVSREHSAGIVTPNPEAIRRKSLRRCDRRGDESASSSAAWHPIACIAVHYSARFEYQAPRVGEWTSTTSLRTGP